MRQTKKGNQWHFGMKMHIGVDADSGFVHTLTMTAANAHDVTEAANLLHSEEAEVFAASSYRDADKRGGVRQQHSAATWRVAMMPDKRKRLDKTREVDALINALERLKAGIRSKVEHPFRVLKRQFGYTKVKYQGLAKNTADLQTLLALLNPRPARKRLLQVLRG